MASDSKGELTARKEHLLQLIKYLRKELSEVEKRLTEAEPPTKLNREFFDRAVYPILVAAGAEGLPGSAIREQLNQMGYRIQPNPFRLFLTRAGKRGAIELVKTGYSHGRWRLVAPKNG